VDQNWDKCRVILEKTRNQKHHSKATQYRQDVRQSGANCYLNSNQSLRSIVYVLENFCRTFGNLVAPPIDIATTRLVHFKVRLVL